MPALCRLSTISQNDAGCARQRRPNEETPQAVHTPICQKMSINTGESQAGVCGQAEGHSAGGLGCVRGEPGGYHGSYKALYIWPFILKLRTTEGLWNYFYNFYYRKNILTGTVMVDFMLID